MKKKIKFFILFLVTVLVLCACSNKVLETTLRIIKEVKTDSKEKNEVPVVNVVGNWQCEENEKIMEHFKEDVYFGENGTFLSSTWREKYVGKYKIDKNKITVSYDFYFKPAGSTNYAYEWSGTKNFELVDKTLKLKRNVLEDGTVFDDEKIYIRKESKDNFESEFYDNVILKE